MTRVTTTLLGFVVMAALKTIPDGTVVGDPCNPSNATTLGELGDMTSGPLG